MALLETEVARTSRIIEKAKANKKPGVTDKIVENAEKLFNKAADRLKEIEQELKGNISAEERQNLNQEIQKLKKDMQLARLAITGDSRGWDAICNAAGKLFKGGKYLTWNSFLLIGSVVAAHFVAPLLTAAILGAVFTGPFGWLALGVAAFLILACVKFMEHMRDTVKNAPMENRANAQRELNRRVDSNQGVTLSAMGGTQQAASITIQGPVTITSNSDGGVTITSTSARRN